MSDYEYGNNFFKDFASVYDQAPDRSNMLGALQEGGFVPSRADVQRAQLRQAAAMENMRYIMERDPRGAAVSESIMRSQMGDKGYDKFIRKHGSESATALANIFINGPGAAWAGGSSAQLFAGQQSAITQGGMQMVAALGAGRSAPQTLRGQSNYGDALARQMLDQSTSFFMPKGVLDTSRAYGQNLNELGEISAKLANRGAFSGMTIGRLSKTADGSGVQATLDTGAAEKVNRMTSEAAGAISAMENIVGKKGKTVVMDLIERVTGLSVAAEGEGRKAMNAVEKLRATARSLGQGEGSFMAQALMFSNSARSYGMGKEMAASLGLQNTVSIGGYLEQMKQTRQQLHVMGIAAPDIDKTQAAEDLSRFQNLARRPLREFSDALVFARAGGRTEDAEKIQGLLKQYSSASPEDKKAIKAQLAGLRGGATANEISAIVGPNSDANLLGADRAAYEGAVLGGDSAAGARGTRRRMGLYSRAFGKEGMGDAFAEASTAAFTLANNTMVDGGDDQLFAMIGKQGYSRTEAAAFLESKGVGGAEQQAMLDSLDKLSASSKDGSLRWTGGHYMLNKRQRHMRGLVGANQQKVNARSAAEEQLRDLQLGGADFMKTGLLDQVLAGVAGEKSPTQAQIAAHAFGSNKEGAFRLAKAADGSLRPEDAAGLARLLGDPELLKGLGTPEGTQKMVEAAQAKGLGVAMDPQGNMLVVSQENMKASESALKDRVSQNAMKAVFGEDSVDGLDKALHSSKEDRDKFIKSHKGAFTEALHKAVGNSDRAGRRRDAIRQLTADNPAMAAAFQDASKGLSKEDKEKYKDLFPSAGGQDKAGTGTKGVQDVRVISLPAGGEMNVKV